MTTLAELREGLQRCPAHDDRRPSLSVRRAPDGKWLLYCYGGCRPEAIVAGFGLRMRDLFPDAGPAAPRRPRRGESPLMQARGRVLKEARRQQRRLEPFVGLYDAADFIRGRLHAAARARRLACELGPSEPAWSLLRKAAQVEGEAWAVEATLEAILAGGKLA